jgi:hypothetical protein
MSKIMILFAPELTPVTFGTRFVVLKELVNRCILAHGINL